MQLSNLQLVLVLLTIMDTYVYYKYMEFLFGAPYVNKRITLLSYIGYYLISAVLYLFLNSSLILLVFNIIACIGLTFFYRASLIKRILSSVLYCLVLLCIEFIYFMFFQYESSIHSNTKVDGPIWQALIVKITEYTAAYILSIFLSKKNDEYLPRLLWFRITLIPIVSLCAIVNLTYFNIGIEKSIAIIAVILTINIAVILIYIEISEEYAEKFKHLIIKKQNEYYVNQFELMNESIKIRNAEKHDFKNHLSVIGALVQRNEQKESAEYIANLMDVYKSVKESYNSGNLVIDSILNYKTQEAEQYEIKINVGLSIPENLQVNSFDMTTILGNIIDNAINATKRLDKDKLIDLKIRYDKGRLLIRIDNPFNGEIKYKNKKLVTLHPDRENHGIGLNNVRMILEKYDGTLEIEHTDNVFSANLMMFVS